MKNLLLFTILFSLINISFCTSSVSGNGSQVGNPKVTGQVYDINEKPVNGATIYLRPFDYTFKDSTETVHETETDSLGCFKFLAGLDSGIFIVEVIENDSSKAFIEKFTLTLDDSINIVARVLRTGDLKGVVKNSPNSNVYIQGLNNYSLTDSLGDFIITNIPDGDFVIVVENKDFDSVIIIDSVTILPDSLKDIGIIEFDVNNLPYDLLVVSPQNDNCLWSAFDNNLNFGSIDFIYNSKDLDLNDVKYYELFFSDDSLNLDLIYSGYDTSVTIDSIIKNQRYYYKICVTDLVDTISLSGTFTMLLFDDNESYIALRNRSFMMGSSIGDSDEMPEHQVSFDYDIIIERTEVTQKDFNNFMMTYYDTLVQIEWDSLVGLGDSFPAYYVSWFEAALYCNAKSKYFDLDTIYSYASLNSTMDSGIVLDSVGFDFNKNGYRLPTEAEWEYFCRALTTGDYYWGNSVAANYTVYNQSKAEMVASRIPNDFVLYDINGNLWEWCNDYYYESYYSVSDTLNPVGPVTGVSRVVRGGSFSGDLHSIRSSDRFGYSSKTKVSDGGFRCVRIVH